jgi:hypothetical protein
MNKDEIYHFAGFSTEEILELEKERLLLDQSKSLFSFNRERLQFETINNNIPKITPFREDVVGQPQFRAHLFLVIDNLPYAVSNMQTRKIPDEIIRKTFSDISLWFRYFKREFCMCGFSSRIIDWFNHHFEGNLYQLGRLQFEIAPLNLEFEGLHMGAPVVKIHVPEGGRLQADVCDQAFIRAEWFFSEIYTYDFQAYLFDSWFCDQEFMRLLPESSNILKFIKRFALIRQSADKNDEIYQRIFGGRAVLTGIVDYPLRTSLQRIMYPFFKEKIQFGSGVGILLKDPKIYN